MSNNAGGANNPNPFSISVAPLMGVEITCQSNGPGGNNPVLQRVTLGIGGSPSAAVIFQGSGNGPMPIIVPDPVLPPSSALKYVILPELAAYSIVATFEYGDGINWKMCGELTINTNSEGGAIIQNISSTDEAGSATLTIAEAIVAPPPPVFNTAPPESVVQALPVNASLGVPGVYPTNVIENVNGNPLLVIQLWKGFCPNIPQLQDVAGGAGAEVGIYLKKSTGDTSWWPDYLNLQSISYTLSYIDTISGNRVTFFTADATTCWWRHMWMQPESFAIYLALNPGAPKNPADYTLEFQVGDLYSGTW